MKLLDVIRQGFRKYFFKKFKKSYKKLGCYYKSNTFATPSEKAEGLLKQKGSGSSAGR